MPTRASAAPATNDFARGSARNHLVLLPDELLVRAAGPADEQRRLPALNVASGPALLGLGPDAAPSLAPAGPGVPSPTTRDGRLWIEPVHAGARPSLLVLRPQRTWLRVNGAAAPRASLLEVGDQLQLTPTWLLHLSLHAVATPTEPPAEAIGRPCAICLEPFQDSSRVWLCPRCNGPLHAEDPAADADALECARSVSRCPGCEGPVEFRSGLIWEPKGL